MRRLREHQFVTLEVERPSGSIECLVLSIDGGEATLQPVDESQLALLPTTGKDVMLTFEHRSQLVMLRGSGRRDDGAQDLRFAVTDRVTVPQRRKFARVDVALPLTLTPLEDGGGAPAGDPIQTRTRDLSADGILAEELLPASQPEWRIRLEVPDDGPPIVCQGRIVRNVGGGTAMRYTSIATEERERLKQFVAARKRKILANLRKQSR
jgi:hypothetical protein